MNPYVEAAIRMDRATTDPDAFSDLEVVLFCYFYVDFDCSRIG